MSLRGSRSSSAGVTVLFATLLLLCGPAAAMAAPLAWSAPAHVDTAGAITSVSCPAADFCAAVDSARNLLTSDPASATWPVTGTDTGTPLSVSCGSSSFCALGDSGGRAMSYTNGSWGPRVAPPGQSFAITAVSCTSSVFCFAGTDVTTTPRTVDGGATWEARNTQGVNYPGSIRAVSCAPGADATTGFCMVVDSSNAAFPSSDSGLTFLPGNRPDGVISGASQLNSVSCTSSTSCVTVDAAGKAYYYRGGVAGGADWTAVAADPGRALESVSCVAGSPSDQTFCAAVDAGGYAIETVDGGATWSAPALITGSTGTPPLNAVSCAAASFCVAVDNGGNAYTGAPQAAPANGGTAPTVANGPPQVGRSPALSCSDAGVAWTGPSPSIAYRWQSSAPSSGSWANIALNGGGQTYAPVPGDAGTALRCVVTATNAGGATDAMSAATAPVLQAAAPPSTTAPAAEPAAVTSPAEPPSPAALPAAPLAEPSASPLPAPSNRFSASPVGLGRDRHLVARYVLPGAGVVEVVAHHRTPGSERVVLARATRVVRQAGRITIQLRLSPAGRRMLSRNRLVHIMVTTRFTPVGGTARQSSRIALVREIAGTTEWAVTDVTGAA
jgi:hypothetical protein